MPNNFSNKPIGDIITTKTFDKSLAKVYECMDKKAHINEVVQMRKALDNLSYEIERLKARIDKKFMPINID